MRSLFTGEIGASGRRGRVPTSVAIGLGRAASRLSRATGRGDGAVIGARLALLLRPDALRESAAGRRVALVTGTNGKTTTTRMISVALEAAGLAVASNSTGANMIDGQLGALMARPHAGYAVLEVDEPHLAAVAEQVGPDVLVLLNLSRDQLDRVGEIRTVCESLRRAVADSPRATVVANVDDPAIVHAASASNRVVWVSAGSRWREDQICPRCGAAIDLGVRDWACGCGFARPVPDWVIAGQDVVGPHGTMSLRLRLPGAVNRANAVVAIAAAEALGCPALLAAQAIEGLEQISGRYRELPVAGRQARLLLAKNPAGWTEMLGMLGDRPIVLVVNSREADGVDVSWLWDVPFEQLGRRRVLVAGERAVDLAVRLRYAEVDHSVVPDPVTAIGSSPGNPDVLATYSAFRALARSAA